MAKKDLFIVTTPVAEIGYAWLRKPDTAFNKDGDYKADFFLPPEEATEFCKLIESDPRSLVKGKKIKVKGTKQDGLIKFKSKQHAVIKIKKDGKDETIEIKPKLFYIVDGKTVPYPEDAPAPFAGSKGELELEVVPFEGFGGGISFRLRAIRLHEIVEGTSGGSGNSWSDTPEGYTSGKKQYEASDAEGAEDDTGSDDSDAEDDDDDDDTRW